MRKGELYSPQTLAVVTRWTIALIRTSVLVLNYFLKESKIDLHMLKAKKWSVTKNQSTTIEKNQRSQRSKINSPAFSGQSSQASQACLVECTPGLAPLLVVWPPENNRTPHQNLDCCHLYGTEDGFWIIRGGYSPLVSRFCLLFSTKLLCLAVVSVKSMIKKRYSNIWGRIEGGRLLFLNKKWLFFRQRHKASSFRDVTRCTRITSTISDTYFISST